MRASSRQNATVNHAGKPRSAALPAGIADHEAMLAGDEPKVMEIRNEARELAIKLNGGELLGI